MQKFYINEYKRAEELLVSGFTEGKFDYQELLLVAKYYRWIDGLGSVRIEKKLVEFVSKWDNNYNLVVGQNTIKLLSRKALQYRLRIPISVPVTLNEINNIQRVKDFKKQKLLFILLIIAKELKFDSIKVKKSNRVRLHGYFISNEILPAIKKLAGLRITNIELRNWYHEFYNLGLIDATYTNSIKLLFADESGYAVIRVSDWDDPILQYVEYCGGEIKYCLNCGDKFIKKGKRHEYCDNCSETRRREKNLNYVRKHRSKK